MTSPWQNYKKMKMKTNENQKWTVKKLLKKLFLLLPQPTLSRVPIKVNF